jgi:membrane protein implicated in regulation of membrane protease activity
MTWTNFYLICFVVGLVFSVLSLLGSAGRFHVGHWHHAAHWHLPHFHGRALGSVRAPHVGTHGAIGGRLAATASGSAAVRGTHVSLFNFSSLMAFLAWFGGTGYLLTRYSSLMIDAVFAVALLGGLLAGGAVFLFLVKVLLAHETQLDPADFDRTGALGKVNVKIRSGGTGEIVFSQGGTRQTAGARSETGEMIPKGTEVVITRCEKGIAYVRRYDEMTGERQEPAGAPEANRQ